MAWETYKMVIGSNGLGVILYSVLFCFLVPANSAVDPYQVSEQVPPGTYVGNISADFDLRSMTTLEEFNKLVYSIFASENDFGSFFRITQETGVLYTTDAIDRDSIPQCARIEQCILTLDIGVQSTLGAFFRKIQVEILVSDLNDNSPQFLNTIDTAQFSENSIDGTTASITGAQDKDAGNNSIVRYYIETPNVPFDVIMESNPDGSSLATLVVKGELDREKQSFYELKVVAEDGGVPKRTGTVDVNVTILDVNDNDPVFDKPFYNVTLKEDISLNEIFETVRATDADAGENGRVEYRMSANTDSDIAKLFAINATSGELRVIGQLVYIHNEQMRVYIEASDQGLQRRFSQVVVYINILDSSNNPPQIKLNILKGDDVNKIARVSEYANIGAVIAYITVSDDDTGRNGEVVCISLSDMFETERYANKEYKTVVLEPLNRELFEVHEVTIVCRDNGAPAMNTSVTFTVEVEDENDNSPRFSQVNYYANSAENNRVGDVVARVRATDADTGNNSKIEYSLVDSGGYDFWMDPVSGEIRANFVLDRENISKIVLEVIAGDFGSPRLTSTTLVTLTITDVNDNYPIFSQPNYEFIVNEGDAVNTTVDQLTATDQDFGSNGSVTFNFSSPPPKDYPFMLFSDGTLKMIRGLDREVQSKYEFMVVAADGGSPSLSSSVTVTIAVYDVNDNPPVFLFPDDSNNTATIPLSNPPDKVSIIIKASDNDEGVNSVLSYQILDKNVSELFIMESKNGYGVIKLHRLPGPSEALRYRLRLLAEDHGTPRQSSIKTLNVVFIKDSPSDSTKHNFLIAITLGCVTVVISIAIVIIICLIRRHDKLKNKDCSACAFNEKADLEIVPVETKINMHALNGSQSSGSRESLKKVSFSTDFNCSADSDNSVRDLTGTLLVTHDTFKVGMFIILPSVTDIGVQCTL